MEKIILEDNNIVILKAPSNIASGRQEVTDGFKDDCIKILEDGATKVILDLNDVAMLPSSVLGHIIIIHKKLSEKNGKIVLLGARDYVKKAFEISRLDQIIKICNDLDDSINQFK